MKFVYNKNTNKLNDELWILCENQGDMLASNPGLKNPETAGDIFDDKDFKKLEEPIDTKAFEIISDLKGILPHDFYKLGPPVYNVRGEDQPKKIEPLPPPEPKTSRKAGIPK